VSRTLLQNIQVLSAGTDFKKMLKVKRRRAGGQPAGHPEQAETLSLASNQTKIQLVLRNPLDTKVAVVPGTTTSNLFSGQLEHGQSHHMQRKAHQIHYRRGVKRL